MDFIIRSNKTDKGIQEVNETYTTEEMFYKRIGIFLHENNEIITTISDCGIDLNLSVYLVDNVAKIKNVYLTSKHYEEFNPEIIDFIHVGSERLSRQLKALVDKLPILINNLTINKELNPFDIVDNYPLAINVVGKLSEYAEDGELKSKSVSLEEYVEFFRLAYIETGKLEYLTDTFHISTGIYDIDLTATIAEGEAYLAKANTIPAISAEEVKKSNNLERLQHEYNISVITLKVLNSLRKAANRVS